MKPLIVIPTYNERENIEVLIGRLLKMGLQLEILVVDDNSPDGTAAVVRKLRQLNDGVHLLERPKKKGIGPAYIAGFKWALKHEYDYIIEMDADLSHRPRYLREFLNKAREYDLVVGSRWIKGGRIVNWAMYRTFLSRLANFYCRLVLGVKMKTAAARRPIRLPPILVPRAMRPIEVPKAVKK